MTIALQADNALSGDQPARARARWLHVLPLAFSLGFVTFAFVMMWLDVQAAAEMLRQWLDGGSIVTILSRRWFGGDFGNVLTGTVFFTMLWLIPVALIRLAATSTNAIWCIGAMTALASFFVLFIAVACFVMLYVHTADVSNALTWPSPRSALFAAIVLVPAVVTTVLAKRSAVNHRLHSTGDGRG